MDWCSEKGRGGQAEPAAAGALSCTQGLVLWLALKEQLSLRCEVRFQAAAPLLDDFVAQWAQVLETWRADRDMSLSRLDLQHLLDQLHA